LEWEKKIYGQLTPAEKIQRDREDRLLRELEYEISGGRKKTGGGGRGGGGGGGGRMSMGSGRAQLAARYKAELARLKGEALRIAESNGQPRIQDDPEANAFWARKQIEVANEYKSLLTELQTIGKVRPPRSASQAPTTAAPASKAKSFDDLVRSQTGR
jgi:hypothetical protein